MENALKAAIRAAGSANKLAEILGVSPQAISQWRRVPPLRVIQVETATGISRHKLRPDLYPPPRVDTLPSEQNQPLATI